MTATEEHPRMAFDTFYNVVNGKLVTAEKTMHCINPSTLEANPEVPVSTQDDVDRAVSAAKAAQAKWEIVSLADRQKAVLGFGMALNAHKEEFANLLTKEQGKPISFARDEIDAACVWLTAQAKLPFPEDVIQDNDDEYVVTRYTPLGVAVAIVPWNFPVLLACGKIPPALVAGNALILKPSPFTPYSGLKLAELAQQFFPPGVFQVLSGGDDLGPMLTEHPGIDKVSFTGSSATGKRVMESCSRTLKRVTLELGGNDPAIICEDVDIKAVAPQIAQLALANSGQVCIAIKRVYVHSTIYDEFLAELVAVTNTLKVGDGFTDGVTLGPVQNALQFDRVKSMLANIRDSDLQIASGADFLGSFDTTEVKGYFLQPVIVDNPPDTSQIVTDELFGPIFPVLKWDTEEEVLRRANDSNAGLGASVWSRDLDRASRIAKGIKAGSVWVNSHLAPRPDAAFGGYKESGLGAEFGSAGLKAYCNTQTLFLRKK